MSRRGVVLEIEGQAVAYATRQGAPTSWATTVRSAIMKIPQGSILSVDFDSFKANTGGTEVEVTDIASELLHFLDNTTTKLTDPLVKSISAATVSSTTGYSSSGTIWIGREAITYTGITPTTFTGLTRGALGTTDRAHVTTSVVYPYNPTLLGRKCVLTWYDLDNTTTKTIRYTGYIDAVDFQAASFNLQILSSKKVFEDAVALQLQQSKAQLVNSPYVSSSENDTILYFSHSSSAQGSCFSLPVTSDNWEYYYLRIDDELIRYSARNIKENVFSSIIDSVASAYEVDIEHTAGFEKGRPIEFLNGGGALSGTGTILDRGGRTYASETIKHNAGYTPSVGNTVYVPNFTRLTGVQRGALFTKQQDHEVGAAVSEYRVLEGNQVDILLWMMLSIDGDKANTDYDILPKGWGAGIDASLIDIASFEDLLRPRSSFRRYVMQEKVSILDFLGEVAAQTNTRIYWGISGTLTVAPVSDVYPLDTTTKAIDKSKIVLGTFPRISIDMSHIRNIWEWGSDFDLDGDKRSTMRVSIEESRRLYGDREMPQVEDKGMRQAESIGVTFPIVEALLSHRSAPVSIITAQIIFDENDMYAPGELVSVTIPHLPDMAAGKGITNETFEVLSYAPEEESAMATITLAKRRTPDKLGHIAPCGVVESILSGDVFEMRGRELTLLAPVTASFTPPGGGGFDGAEDIHWLLEGDAIIFVDASTLGQITPTTASYIITGIDYGALNIQVDAPLPAWLAADDLVRLDDWATVGSTTTTSYRRNIFIALADETTQLIGPWDDPYRWGV